MPRAARVLLIWLVAALVPLKGLAAATLLGCGPGHAAGWTERGAVDMHAGHAGAADQTAHAHGHAVAQDAQGAADVQEPAAGAGDAAAKKGNSSLPHGLAIKCSSCAPCCAAAAPAPRTLEVSAVAPVTDLVVFRVGRYVGIVPDVPHRPPRPILA